MSITFSCTGCGRTLKVADELAGRKAKCPQCQTVLYIPEGPAVAVTPVPAPARRQAAPMPRRQQEVYDDQGDMGDEADAAPRRRKKAKKSAMVPILLAVGAVLLLVVLAGGGFAAWWFWGGGGASADLVYMPDNVQMVGQMHADQIMNSDALKQVYAAFPDLKKMVDENSSKSTGIDQNNVDRMYFGVAKVDGKSNTAPAAIAVIHFKNSVKVEDIEKGMKQGASSPANNAFGMSVDYSFSDSKVGRYTVTEVKQTMTFKAQPGFNPPPAPPTTLYAFTMPDDKRVVMGSPEALKAVLNRDKKPDINATLQKAIDATDWNATIAFAANVKDGFVIPPETAKTFPLPIDKVDALSATIKVGSDVDVNVTAMCKDNQAATDLSGGINTLIKAGTNSPAMASMDPALKDLMNITAQANGSNVTIAKTIKVSPLLAAAKKGGGGMMFNMFGGGFGGAPAAPDFGPPPAKPQKGK